MKPYEAKLFHKKIKKLVGSNLRNIQQKRQSIFVVIRTRGMCFRYTTTESFFDKFAEVPDHCRE